MGFDMTKIQATFDGVAVSGKQQADGDILFGITEKDFPIVATIGGDKAKALEKFVLKVDGVVQDIK